VITEWLISVATSIAGWLVGLLPTWTVPSQITGFDDTLNEFIGGFGGLGVWVPWALVVICVGISVGAWLIGVGVKALRWVVGLIPTMGGGT